MNPIFLKKTSLPYTLGFIFLASVATFLVTTHFSDKEANKILELKQTSDACVSKIERLEGYPFVKPLLFVDDVCEGDGLATIKQDVTSVIENYKAYKGVT